MATTTVNRREDLRKEKFASTETFANEEEVERPLSKKAQEAKIFLERNPVPKEFLKS